MNKLVSIVLLLLVAEFTICQVKQDQSDTSACVSINARIISPTVIESISLQSALNVPDTIQAALHPDSLYAELGGSMLDIMDAKQPEKNEPVVTKPSKSTESTLLSDPVIRTEPFVLTGRIMDAETGESEPFATIRVEKAGLGTASNADGDWTLRLPASASKEIISFKYLGYVTQSVNISNLPNHSIIRLKQSSYELAQVVVSPDKQFEVLRAAWNAIPQNYPTEPTITKGFYRETQRVNDSLFLYFNEAVLNVYKNTYKNNRNFGQIEVEKSRKNVFPGIDSINDIRFYGGPHFPNELDIVFSRWDFIKPSEFKNWRYDLEGMFKDSLSEVYTIAFKNKLKPYSNFQGRMFIDANSYAYIGFELKRIGVGSISSEDIPTNVSYLSGTTTIKIGYTEKNEKQFLSHISYKTNGINTATKTRIYKDIEYITTTIETDSVFPIPYSRQFDYTDILSIKADNYEQTYWKDYNILQENKVLNTQTELLYGQEKAIEQLKKVYNKELTEQEKVLMFLKRFTFEGGISVQPIRYVGGEHLIGYGINPLGSEIGKSVKSVEIGLSTMDGIRFMLNKQLSLFTNISTALIGMDQIQSDLGLTYRMTVFPSGRWIFLDIGVGASLSTSKLPLYNIANSSGSMQIDGKTFDSGSMAVKAGNAVYGAKGVVGLAVRMGKRYELFVDGHYLMPLIKRDYVQFKESEGPFLKRKSAKVDWNDPNLFYYVDDARIITPRFEVEPYYFRVGIRSGF